MSGHQDREADRIVQAVIDNRLQHIDRSAGILAEDDAFFVCDLGEVYRRHSEWVERLTRITPHYAIKSNPDPQILHRLAALGTGFDCASVLEIQQVINLGIDSSRIIFAHPCKAKAAIRFAKDKNVRKMTFDSVDELFKIKEIYPDSDLFLRIFADDVTAPTRLGTKFGAPMSTTGLLLDQAKALHLNIAGVSFHVGSGGSDPDAVRKAVRDARLVFEQAELKGFKLYTIDVGGGFVSGPGFLLVAASLNRALDENFYNTSINAVAEPGRYLVNSAFT